MDTRTQDRMAEIFGHDRRLRLLTGSLASASAALPRWDARRLAMERMAMAARDCLHGLKFDPSDASWDRWQQVFAYWRELDDCRAEMLSQLAAGRPPPPLSLQLVVDDGAGPYPIGLVGEVLRRPARPVAVEDFGLGLQAVAAEMMRLMHASGGIGLAAPQVAISRRVFVYQDPDTGTDRALANPELLPVAGAARVLSAEECLSLPGQPQEVHRPEAVRVTGKDPLGRPVSFVAEGPHAIVLSHESDHLDGVLIDSAV